jgi:RNA polymerase sigma factor (sigma-70 family)
MTMELRHEDLLAHAEWMRRLAAALTRDEAAADDAVQTTWLAALEHPPKRDRPLGPWLGTVLRNAIRKRGRADVRRGRRDLAVAKSEGVVPATDEVMGRAEMAELLSSLVAELPEPYRSTISQRYYEDLSPTDIARRQGVPAGTVRSRLHHGLLRLRQRLDERCGNRRAWMLALLPWLKGPGTRGSHGVRPVLVKGALVIGVLGLCIATGRLITKLRASSVSEPTRLADVTSTSVSARGRASLSLAPSPPIDAFRSWAQERAAGGAVTVNAAAAPSCASPMDQILGGLRLPAEQARALEGQVTNHPNDGAARATLIGYYFAHYTDQASVRAQRAHVRWFLSSCPQTALPPGIVIATLPGVDPEGYEELKTLLSKNLASAGHIPEVNAGAAGLLSIMDSSQASQLLALALSQDPNRPEWLIAQGRAQLRHSQPALALGSLELAVELDPSARFDTLDSMAKAALAASDVTKARRYAEELLNDAEEHREDYNYANAIHQSHLVLGLVALGRNDVTEAERQLILAGKIPGSPQLSSFGPNMSLAKALLERGKKETVLDFLRECSSIWESGWEDGTLTEWANAIRENAMPDFGANLRY